MVAKGLDFENVTLVGVIATDVALNLPDFRAAERTFQLLCQVAGRAGRGERRGLVVIQTYNPDHPAVRAARAPRLSAVSRGRTRGPPRGRVSAVRRAGALVISAEHEHEAQRRAEVVAGARGRGLSRGGRLGRSVGAGAGAFIQDSATSFRYHVICKAAEPELLHKVVVALDGALTGRGAKG